MDPPDIIDTLDTYLRNERSAVAIYELALKNVEQIGLPALLDDCRRSHLERAEAIQRHIVELGGEPSTAAGAWGAIAQVIDDAMLGVREKVGIAALEELEYQDLKRYRDELAKLDEAAARLMRTQVLPKQERTYQAIRSIRDTIS